ncbi:hypothetical protein LCGC14_2998610 [marine sediment metagenome]|uniref:Uncharacterized protein n=1 Tax=marine sediment metagenome TaxID=412755 RepID=A0A0F8XPA5_9ZZZZ
MSGLPNIDNGAQTEVTVGASSVAALATSAGRSYVLFINDSDAAIYLNIFGAAAEMNKGVRLEAAGGTFEMSARKGNLTTKAVAAISSAASKNLIVIAG